MEALQLQLHLLEISLFFPWLHLCQDQATCAQPEGLGRTNIVK